MEPFRLVHTFLNSLVHCTVVLFVCLYCIVLCCIFCVSTLRVTLPSQIPCLCKLTWPIKPDSDSGLHPSNLLTASHFDHVNIGHGFYLFVCFVEGLSGGPVTNNHPS